LPQYNNIAKKTLVLLLFRSLNTESEISLLLVSDSKCGVAELLKDSSEANLPSTVYYLEEDSKIQKLADTGRKTIVVVMTRLANVQVRTLQFEVFSCGE
jgi:hypothetical protein